MILGVEIVNDQSNPAGNQNEDDGDGFATCADVHFQDFEDGLDAKDEADKVDDCCYHSNVIL